MKIECPACHLTGTINELEMPPEGRHVNCPRCKNPFHVAKPPPAAWSPGMMNICPACQYSTFSVEMFAVCPKCGLVGSDYQEKHRKRPEKEQELREQDPVRSSLRNPDPKMPGEMELLHEQERLLRSHRNPDLLKAPTVETVKVETPLPVRAVGWSCIVAGGALLLYGMYGLVTYYIKDWQAILSEPLLEPLSKTAVFFRIGFFPWLFTLFSLYFLTMAGRFLMLRAKAPQGLMKGAWAGVAVAAVHEIADFITWVRLSSSEASISYYAVGILDTLLMAALWCSPCLALLWMVRSDWIRREFTDS